MAAARTSTAGDAIQPPLILTIDIGSSSTRARLYDRSARSVPGIGAQEHSSARASEPGVAEEDPGLALERVARCVDAVLERAGPLAAHIGAVAVDTFVTNILAIDSRGDPLTPIITYADTRNAADAVALRQALDEREVHDRTGCLLRTSYWPARLAWYRRLYPEIWRAAARWITLGEYLELRFFGRCRASYSAASWGGLLDRRRLAWDAPLLDYLGLREGQLSPLVDVDEPLYGLARPYSDRWPALRAIPWFPAIGDGAAANVGSGCVGHERIALTVGTTSALRVIEEAAPRVPAGLWCYRVDRHSSLLGGATSEGGNVYAWVQETLQLGDPASIEAALATRQPDQHGLTVLPLFAGERSPGWAGNARATFHGLTLATTSLDILQASLEAVAYRCALIERGLCNREQCSHRLIASGGALRHSPAWTQILADVMGRPIVSSGEAEATSRGVALLALRSLGEIDAIDAIPATDGPIFHPDLPRHAIYLAAIDRQQWLYDRLVASTGSPVP